MQIRVLEGRVAQTPSKRKQGLRRRPEVAAPRRWLLVIVIGKLTDRPRHRDRQPSAGISVAEQHIGDGGSTFLSQIPSIENGGDIFSNVVDGVRASVE